MRGRRRFTLVPSLSVATSSQTGAGWSETEYLGFAILLHRKHDSRAVCACDLRRRSLPADCNADRLIARGNVRGHGHIDLIETGETGRQAGELHGRILTADRHPRRILGRGERRRGCYFSARGRTVHRTEAVEVQRNALAADGSFVGEDLVESGIARGHHAG